MVLQCLLNARATKNTLYYQRSVTFGVLENMGLSFHIGQNEESECFIEKYLVVFLINRKVSECETALCISSGGRNPHQSGTQH